MYKKGNAHPDHAVFEGIINNYKCLIIISNNEFSQNVDPLISAVTKREVVYCMDNR